MDDHPQLSGVASPVSKTQLFREAQSIFTATRCCRMNRSIKKDYAIRFVAAVLSAADEPTNPLDQLTGEVSTLSNAMVANGIGHGKRNILRHAHEGGGSPYGPKPHLLLENGRWRTTRAFAVEYGPFKT